MHTIDNSKLVFPYKTDRKILIFGGHENFLKRMKLLLPDVRLVPYAKRLNPDIVRNADVIWIQDKNFCHSAFGNVMRYARLNNVPVNYFSYISPDKCAEEVVTSEMLAS